MADINIDLDDLANALLEELSYKTTFHSYEKEPLKQLRDELVKKFPKEGDIDNLADQMKMEFLMEIREKYPEAQLREMEFEYRDRHNIK